MDNHLSNSKGMLVWGENLVDGKIRKEKGMENMGFPLFGSQGKVGGKLEVHVFSI